MPKLKPEVREALDAIGVKGSPFIPEGADTSELFQEGASDTSQAQPAQPSVSKPPAKLPDGTEYISSEDEPEPETQTEQEPESPEQLTEEQRRTWQSEADRAKAEAAAAEERLRLLEQQNQMLMTTMQTYQNFGQAIAPKPAAPASDKEPAITDFITADSYDPQEAADPRTLSGQAYQQFLDARADWRARQTYARERQKDEERNAQELTRKQAQDLAAAYPEFRNPLNGQPNFQAIQVWMDDLSKRDWVQLKRALDGQTANGTKAATPPPSAEAEIARRADKPPAAAAAGGGGTAPKKVSKTVQTLSEVYGNVWLPPGAEIIE